MKLTSKVIEKLSKLESEKLRELLQASYVENHFLRQSIDEFPMALFALDSELKVLFMNRLAGRYTKKKSKHTRKKISAILHHEELHSILDEMFAELVSKKISKVYREITLKEKELHELEIALVKLPENTAIKSTAEKHGKEKVKNNYTNTTTKPDKPSSSLKNEASLKGKAEAAWEEATFVVILGDFSLWKNRYLQQSEQDSIDSLHILTAGIAHEIRNPLSALDLHIQLLGRLVKKSLFEEKKEFEDLLSVLTSEIRRLDSIVNDFLQSFHPRRAIKKPANLNMIIHSVLDIIGPRLEEKNIRIQLMLGKLQLFSFDEDLMIQLLLNVLKNSMESILETERVAGRIIIKTADTGSVLSLSIQDNGMGVSPDELSKIVKPFYTSKKIGTGLGLSIISGIANAHRGKVRLNTRNKKTNGSSGFEFCIDFHRISPYQGIAFKEEPRDMP